MDPGLANVNVQPGSDGHVIGVTSRLGAFATLAITRDAVPTQVSSQLKCYWSTKRSTDFPHCVDGKDGGWVELQPAAPPSPIAELNGG